MTSTKHLNLSNHKIWKGKNIKPEGKKIYAYLYSEAFDKLVAHINIGDIQNKIHITNVGFKNNLKILEKFKYLVFKEYDNGLYEYHIY